MAQVHLTPSAEESRLEIWLYIAQRNLPAADRLLEKIDAVCERLAEYPRLGRAREDLGAGLRSHPVGNYLIIYRPTDAGVEILHVLHGARRIEEFFAEGGHEPDA